MEVSNNTLIVPPALQAKVEQAAAEEHRPAIDMLRDFIERGLNERRAHRPAADTGDRVHTPAEAAARIRELRKGTFLPEGVTIRDLIDYGRA